MASPVGRDIHKLLEKRRQLIAEMEREPERFAKVIFEGYYFAGENRGFTVYETDDLEKLWSDVVIVARDEVQVRPDN